jgi:short-subunit dehydrogenase
MGLTEVFALRDLRGKNALLTGGSRGLGPYIGRALAREGVNIALTARSETDLQIVAGELAAMGVKAKAIPADITDAASRRKLLDQVWAEFGGIDILINNAGIERLSHYTLLSPEFIETMIQTNLVAPLLLTRLLLPAMMRQGSGHIVTISSMGGKKGSPYTATYAATKAGLIEWTRGLREELRETGVSASVICPGFVSGAGMFAAYRKRAPRIAGETTPEKVAAAVIRSIRNDVGETIVNPGPVRPMIVLDAIHPGIGMWILRTFGLYDFYRRQAEENEREDIEADDDSMKRAAQESGSCL